MKISSFIEYIIEMEKVLSNRSATGKTKEYDVIFDEPESAKSPSSGILLRNILRKSEFDYKLKSNINFKEISKSTGKEKKLYKLEISKNNLKFLLDKEKEGELRCEYCNAGPLVVYGFYRAFNKKNGATADHKEPISKGGPIFDYDNLAVCCYWCNTKKDNMTYSDWMKLKDEMIKETLKIDKENYNIELIGIDDDGDYPDDYNPEFDDNDYNDIFHTKLGRVNREKITQEEYDIFERLVSDNIIRSYHEKVSETYIDMVLNNGDFSQLSKCKFE